MPALSAPDLQCIIAGYLTLSNKEKNLLLYLFVGKSLEEIGKL